MERYRLSELVQLSGVTPRTIRFYIAEGLLPPPEGNGPAAVYTAEHRDRLRLIGLLKDHYLPLKEIRRQLATLTAEEVRERLGQGEGGGGVALPGSAAAGVGAPKPDAALNYLDRVLGQAAAARGVREHQPVGNPPPVAAPPPPFPPATSPRRPQPGNAPSAAPPRERWERIVLADGVELHVREDRRRETGPLEALVRQARKLLGEE